MLFAIGATLKVDFDGAIRIEGLWSGEASAIDAGEIYASGTVDYATPVTEVIVTEHAYSQSVTETTELFKGTTSAGDKSPSTNRATTSRHPGFPFLQAVQTGQRFRQALAC